MPRGDLVLRNAKIITMNPRQPRVEALAVRGGRIAALGGKVGELGDLAALDEDPFAVDPAHIKDIPVLMTVLRGEIVHQRA